MKLVRPNNGAGHSGEQIDGSIVPAVGGAAASVGAEITSATGLSNGVTTVIALTTVTKSTLVDSTIGASSITVGATDAGWYVIALSMIGGGVTAQNYLQPTIKRNGTVIAQQNGDNGSGFFGTTTLTVPAFLAAGDVVTFEGYIYNYSSAPALKVKLARC